ncbi:RNA polymerase sigma factor [Streptacidiphilus carbonis]|uniref:RNA polymerase sigma factor n=1 Tax=Streptacidiphilus carbonis TaxID=105422 RepID=UPI0005AAC8DE|nr:RNA polymerase sigma factor [Streptacidiphilus carbonis]
MHSSDQPAVGVPLPAAEPEADLSAEVRAAQDGDEEAFRKLYRAVQPVLLRYLKVLVGEDAEDVASEAWLQIARDLAHFRGDYDGFRGWAATIGRNRAMDLLRSRRRRPSDPLPFEELVERPAADDTESTVLATDGTAHALALIAKLPRDQAEAVLLRVVLDLDADSAARVLGKRAGAVRMAAHRGLRRLAKLLDQPDAPAVPAQHHPDPGPQKISSPGVTPARASTLKDMR